MKSGYSIRWTSHALSELVETIEYLENNWTKRELKRFASDIEHTSRNPYLFQTSNGMSDVRRAVVTKHNTIYHRVKLKTVEILSCFGNRQNPDKKKL